MAAYMCHLIVFGALSLSLPPPYLPLASIPATLVVGAALTRWVDRPCAMRLLRLASGGRARDEQSSQRAARAGVEMAAAPVHTGANQTVGAETCETDKV